MTTPEVADYEYWYFGPNGPKADKKTGKEEMTTTLPKNSAIHYVFVYGTLLRGYGNHRLLQSSYFVGNGTTKGYFVMFDVGFPLARKPNEGENPWLMGKVRGEVYGVTDAVLQSLDRLEGHPNFYERRVTDIEEYPRMVVQMYQWARQDGRVADSEVSPSTAAAGYLDWRLYGREKKAS